MSTRIRRSVAGRRARIAICAGGVLGGLALLVGALSAGASAGTSVSVASSGNIPSVGGTTTVTVSVTLANADAAMNAYDIVLTWDSSVLSATPAEVQAVYPPFTIVSKSGSAGQLDVTGSDLGIGHIPCTAGVPCALFTVTFHGVGAGSTSVQSVGKQAPFHTMSDGSGTDIEPSSFGSGAIQVGSTSTVTNTPTNSPTVTLTPTPTSTGTATPTPTGTPHPSGYRYVVPQVAKDGSS